MKNKLFLCFCIALSTWLNPLDCAAQRITRSTQIKINSVEHHFTSQGLHISYNFDRSIIAYNQSKLTYQTIKADGSMFPPKEVPLIPAPETNLTLSFAVPRIGMVDASSLRLSAILKGAGVQQQLFPDNLISLESYQNELKAAQDELAQVKAELQKTKISIDTERQVLLD